MSEADGQSLPITHVIHGEHCHFSQLAIDPSENCYGGSSMAPSSRTPVIRRGRTTNRAFLVTSGHISSFGSRLQQPSPIKKLALRPSRQLSHHSTIARFRAPKRPLREDDFLILKTDSLFAQWSRYNKLTVKSGKLGRMSTKKNFQKANYSVNSLYRIFETLHQKKILTDMSSMPLDVRRAKHIRYLIKEKADMEDAQNSAEISDFETESAIH